jgi:hypothetical protein
LSGTGTGTAQTKGPSNIIKDIFDKSINYDKNTYNSPIIIGILYLLSMVYISEKKTIFFGYAILFVAFFATCVVLYKQINYTDMFSNFAKNTTFPLIVVLMILFIGFVFLFKDILINANSTFTKPEKWISLSSLLSISVLAVLYGIYAKFIVGGIMEDMFKKFISGSAIATIMGIVIYNLYSIIAVAVSIIERMQKMESYDINAGKKRWSEFNTYTALFYLFAISTVFLIFAIIVKTPFVMPWTWTWSYSNYYDVLILVAFICMVVSTIVNYYMKKNIVAGLDNDSTNIKKSSQKEEEKMQESNTKIANQNIFTNAYYWFLNLFNDPSILMP